MYVRKMNVVAPSVEITKNESPYSAMVLASNIKNTKDAITYKIIDSKKNVRFQKNVF